MVRSPLTGELVPVDQMAEHMRVSLIDPKWRTQREAMLSKIRETTKASDEEIGANLLGLARKRPDVFGGSSFSLVFPFCQLHQSTTWFVCVGALEICCMPPT